MRGLIRLLMGCSFIVFVGSASLQVSFAQAPLTFGDNFFVTGDYVVAGAQGMTTNFANGYAIGKFTIPDTNPGIHGRTSVPAGAEIMAAVLYWQTVENAGTVPGQPGTGENGFFRPLIANGPPAPGYPITGVARPGHNNVSWSQGGCSEPQTTKITRTYRANVLGALPQDANGNILTNGQFEVRLPSVGPQTPLTLGATLLIVYRILSTTVPLNSIVIYDGAFGQSDVSLNMTQTVQGFYDALHNPTAAVPQPVSKLTLIAGAGKSNKSQTVYFGSTSANGNTMVQLPSHSGSGLPPFPGYYGKWDNPTWTFGDPNYPEIANPMLEDAYQATAQAVPSGGGCVSWGVAIVGTTVKNSDGDGLLDVWKKPSLPNNPLRPGYCDASVNEGVCNQGDPNWVDLPGAAHGQKDIFVQLDYMCSTATGADSCNPTNGTDYSFDPRPSGAIDMVTKAFAANGHGITLHVNPPTNIPDIHAIQEQTCTDIAGPPQQLCAFPNQAGAVAWKGGFYFVKNQLIDPDDPLNVADCATTPPAGDCIPRFQHGRKDSWHYVLFAHAVGNTMWSLQDKTLTSVVQSGNFVTFNTSTAVGTLTNAGYDAHGNPQQDPSCANGRVTIVGAGTNSNLNGTFCIHQPAGNTSFTIMIGGNATNAQYSLATDPNLAVAIGQVNSASGSSDVGGEDSLIALGLWGDATSPTSDGQSVSTMAGTFMHELGHSLGLAHGGFYYDTAGSYVPTIEPNCKPNHQSVMNYMFQVDLLDNGTGTNVPDYSEESLTTLKEAQPALFPFGSPVGNTFYQSTSWYDATNDVGGTATPATSHCDGSPITDNAQMTRVTRHTGTFSWEKTDEDINFNGITNDQLRGYDDWISTVTNTGATTTGVDMRQMGATGSLSVTSEQLFNDGGQNFKGGGQNFKGGGQNFKGGGQNFKGGGQNFKGGGEIDEKLVNSVTRSPRNTMATLEDASPRFIHLSWLAPTFGQIGQYKVYRSAHGGAFVVIATISGNPPATTYTDTVTCDPGGYQYFVTAVLGSNSPNPGQESAPSNTVSTVSTGSDGPLTGCYVVSNFSSSASAVHGSQVQVTWTLTDDFNTAGNPVTRQAANTLVAIGPLPTTGRTTLLVDGVPTSGVDSFTNVANQFTFTWNNTDAFSAGSYTFELDLDHVQAGPAQVQTTASPTQLNLDVNDTDSNPHVATLALTAGTVGLAYNNTLTEDGGTAPFKWTFTVTGPPLSGISQQSQYSPTLSGTTCAAGTYNLTAMVTDSKSNSGTQPLTLQINKANTTTVVASSANPSVWGQMVTFTVTVSPQYTCTPTGTVTLSDEGNPIASNLALSGGMAMFTTSALSVGNHNITASYGGDSNFNGSNSVLPPLVQTVNKASTTITINSVLPSPAVVGQAITVAYTFAVVPPGAGTPTGTVTVAASDGSGCVAPAAPGPRACELSPTPTTAGNNTLTVTYAGDNNFVNSGANGNYTVNIYVSDAAPPPFTPTTTLPNGVAGSPYSNTVYESGGVSDGVIPFTWTIVAGSVMPGSGSTLPGLSFQPNAVGVGNGTLSGTPTASGTFTFTAQVTDSKGNNGTQNFTITVFAPVPAPYGLVSWYPFEGNANDLEKINNGNVVGTPQFVPGEVDNGLKPGPQLSGSLITVPDSPTLALTQFTIGAWVRVDALDNVQTMQIVWKGDATAGDLTTPYSLSVLGSANGSFSAGATVVGTAGPAKVLVILTDGTHELDLVSTNALPLDGKFHYVAVTADGQNVNLYIDGHLDPNTPASETPLSLLPFASANPLQIGGIQGGPVPGNNFDGVIDELQIWNRPLTAAEVSGIFNSVGEYQPVAPAAGLVSWWPAEGNYTDIINGNNGTPSGGVAFGRGEVGQAFSFSGGSAEITVADNANLDVSQITIEAWVKPTSSGHGRPIVQKRSSTNVGGYTFETTDTSDGPGPANGLQFEIWIGGTQYLLQTPANALTINAWQHVAATFDGSKMNIYVNGVSLASQAASGSIDTDSADPLVMGLNVTNAAYDWNGFTDEVSLYNRALSSTEIQAIVNAGGAGKAKP